MWVIGFVTLITPQNGLFCTPEKLKFLAVSDFCRRSKGAAPKTFLRELHRITYPGTLFFSNVADPGKFRAEEGGASRVKKTSDALASPSGIFFKDTFLKNYYQSKGLPDIPTCVLYGTVKNSLGRWISSCLAVSAQCCAGLLALPPVTEAELKGRLLEEPEKFKPSLEELNENIEHLDSHRYAINDWLMIKEAGLFSRPPSRAEWLDYSVFYDFKHVVENIRTLPPPGEFTESMIDSWCQRSVEAIQNIRSERELFKQIAILLCELMAIRPFGDGNCRIAVMVLQGLLMTFGYPPIPLKTRYIFNLGPDEIAKLIENSVKKKISEQKLGLPQRLVSLAADIA